MEYLDYAASTPVDNKVLNTYVEITKKYYANPNSSHYLGLEAKKLIDTKTSHIASLLNIKPTDKINIATNPEVLRNMFMAIAKDIRVVIIKITERFH